MGCGSEPLTKMRFTRRREEGGIMSILSGALALVLLLGTVPVVVWAQADPAKEIADINRKRGEAGGQGGIDGLLGDGGGHGVNTINPAGMRLGGKQGVSALLSHLFPQEPTPPGMRRPRTHRRPHGANRGR